MSKSTMSRITFALLTVMTLLPVSGYANTTQSTVTVKVTVTANNCRINENQPVKAEFGTVQTDNLSAASADVPVTIACDEVPAGTISMSVNGTASTFNTNAIQASITGLGVTLETEQGTLIKPNTFYNVSDTFGLTSKTGVFNLKAGLTSDGKTELPGGEFNASATLVLQVS